MNIEQTGGPAVMADESDIVDIDETDVRRILIGLDERVRPTTTYSLLDTETVLKYFDILQHAYKAFGLEFPLKLKLDASVQGLRQQFVAMTGEIDKLKIDVLHTKVLEKTSVALDITWRDKIHSYLETIRQIVEQADLAAPIHDRIMTKLHALQQEIDRNRASIQKFTDVLVGICEGISKGATTLNPAVRLLERVIGALSRVKSEEQPQLSLPKPEDFGLDQPNPESADEPPQSN